MRFFKWLPENPLFLEPPQIPLPSPEYLAEVRRNPRTENMRLRDWYIGQALTGLLAGRGERSLRFNPEDDAEYLARIADAILAERAKESK